MTDIGFTNKAVAHLTAAIGTADTQIMINANEYEPVLSAQGDSVYLLLRGPANRELVKVDIAASVWGEYLTIARGQGGILAQSWPVGSMLFATTHADHYNAILQRAGNRVISYNPNEVLAPLVAGEKVYQDSPAGCERWWKSFNGVDYYWDIITGDPCAAEGYQDIGWNYPILKAILTEQEGLYYFDGYDVATAWANAPGNMVDGSISTNASFSAAGTDEQLCNSNTAPGSGGTITKVEIRAYGAEGQTSNVALYLQPEFSGGSGDQHDLLADFGFPAKSWSQWFDITNDTNAPGTWSWADVQNMDMTVFGNNSGSGPGDTLMMSKIEIKVTYLGSGWSGWRDLTGPSYWTVSLGSWNGSKYLTEYTDPYNDLLLLPTGTWAANQEPTIYRITFTGQTGIEAYVQDLDGHDISVDLYLTNLEEKTLFYYDPPTDIKHLFLRGYPNALEITKIEMYSP